LVTYASDRDAGCVECLIEGPAGRSRERLTPQIFLVAGLFADKHDWRHGTPRSEHGLSGTAI
jgi:hypothetical protein